MVIYQVVHKYDTDGGFGDAISVEQIIATFESYGDAKAFVDKFAKPHIYERPWSNLTCGTLIVTESDVIAKGELDLDKLDPNDFWWLTNEVLDKKES